MEYSHYPDNTSHYLGLDINSYKTQWNWKYSGYTKLSN